MEASNKSKRSIIRSFAIAGLLVPLILILCNWVGFTIDRNHIPWTMTYQPYVWPCSIMLMATHDNFSIHTLIVLCMSIAVNVPVLYGGWTFREGNHCCLATTFHGSLDLGRRKRGHSESRDAWREAGSSGFVGLSPVCGSTNEREQPGSRTSRPPLNSPPLTHCSPIACGVMDSPSSLK